MGTCFNLTQPQLAILLTAGWTLASGPHATEAACLAVCGSGSGSGSSQPCGTCTPAGMVRVTFHNGTGGCTCLNGITAVLTEGGGIWTNSTDISGCSSLFEVQCTCVSDTGSWLLELGGFAAGSAHGDPGWSCSPLSISFTLAVSGLCSGTVIATITDV